MLRRAAPDARPLRVLKVGAGYGTLTANLLPLLPADRTEYLFTDISTYFTNRAGEVFGEFGFVRVCSTSANLQNSRATRTWPPTW